MSEELTVDTAEVETPSIAVQEVSTEASDDQDMADIYDKLTKEGNDRDENGRFTSKDKPEPEVEEAEEAEADASLEVDDGEADDTVAAVQDAPSYLPQIIREQWKDIPAESRDAFAKSQQEMSVKLADYGRKIQGIGPIQDELVKAAQAFPELANRTPQSIAKEVMELAHTSANLSRDPVGTLLQVAQKTGSLEALAQRLTGSNETSGQNIDVIEMQQQIAKLTSDLRTAQNPENIQAIVNQNLSANKIEAEVSSFSAGKEHWATVEADMPRYVQAAKLINGDGVSNADILNAAYEMALNANGLMAASANPEKAKAEQSPKRTEAVLKAKSVNVTSGSGKQKALSEEDAMSIAYDKMMSN